MGRRLADYVKTDDAALDPGIDALAEEVYLFPDQPSVKDTIGKMAKVVAFGDADEFDPEDEANLPPEQVAPVTPRRSVRDAFDAGASGNLKMPPIPDEANKPQTSTIKKRSTARSGGRPAGSDQFTDLFAAGMITLISFSLGDDFQPTEEEARDLARPLGNILARRIDLAAKLGQDSNDVVSFAVALMAYMVRVGPIAGERVRGAYADRQRRSRADRLAVKRGPADGRGEDSMAAGADDVPSAPNGAAYSPFDALAKARGTQFGVIGRDLDRSPNGRAGMAVDGE